MVTNTDGQPQAGVIGGQRDLGAILGTVEASLISAPEQHIAGDLLPDILGRDFDPAAVAIADIPAADRGLTLIKKALPWGLIAAAALVFFLIMKRGK